MTPPGKRRGRPRKDSATAGRDRQRQVCQKLLDRWVPLATDKLRVRKEERGGPVIDEEPLEEALKAGAYVLKILERMARLDGLDAAEKKELTVCQVADPLELAKRVEAVSPILTERMRLSEVSKE